LGAYEATGPGCIGSLPKVVISAPRYRQISVGALISLSIIIVSGAAVRLTNSGLGCDDWPNCNSERFVDVSSAHAAIEQVNRLFTGVVVIAVIAAVLGSLIRDGRRRDLVVLSWLLVAGVVANALLGAVTVWVDLHPYAVQGHLLLSMGLIAAGTVLVRRAGEPDGVPRRPTVDAVSRGLAGILLLGTSIAIVTGTVVTGAGPHAGDEDAVRLGVDIASAARIHGIAVVATIAIAIGLAVRARAGGPAAAIRPALSRWLFVALLQAAIGYTQYFTGVPAILVGAHVAGATAVQLVTVLILLDTSRCRSEFRAASPVGVGSHA
jgi:cytochrome c oxidase assembly protein subunit 15